MEPMFLPTCLYTEQRFPLFTAIPTHTHFKKVKMEAVATKSPLVPTPNEGEYIYKIHTSIVCIEIVNLQNRIKGHWGGRKILHPFYTTDFDLSHLT